MTPNHILYIFCSLAAIIILAFYLKPFRIILHWLINSGLGFLSLFAINFAGGYIGINIGINVINAAFIGILGLPGIFTLLAVQNILG